MSYRTVEVELDGDRIRPCGSETLPEKARALLTILTSGTATTAGTASNTSLAELVQDLAGIGRGERTDLSTNKAHLADFGR